MMNLELMMPNKPTATYRGECQGCGQVMRLPGGIVADHGFGADHGLSDGKCPGAAKPPLELAYEDAMGCIVLAEGAIEKAAVIAAKYRRHIAQPIADVLMLFSHPKSVAEVLMHISRRDPPKPYGDTFLAENVKLVTALDINDESGVKVVAIATDEDGVVVTSDITRRLPGHPRDPLVAARMINAQWAMEQDRIVENLSAYIKWQEARTASWVPRALTLLPEGISSLFAPIAPRRGARL